MFDLPNLIRSIGYFGVAAIIFAENGLLVGFFLPGDSLLFSAGFLAAQGYFNIWVLLPVIVVASIVGVGTGYAIGQRFGRRLFHRPDSRFFKKENLVRAEQFYQRHGGITIVLARFIPIVRTFAPVVAGVARMPYGAFTLYNIIGGTLWGVGVTLMGFWLGGFIPGVDRYLLPVMGLIIILSIAPGLVQMLRSPMSRPGFLSRLLTRFSNRK